LQLQIALYQLLSLCERGRQWQHSQLLLLLCCGQITCCLYQPALVAVRF